MSTPSQSLEPFFEHLKVIVNLCPCTQVWAQEQSIAPIRFPQASKDPQMP